MVWARRGKYNARKQVASDGTKCASGKERRRYEQLLLMRKNGIIKDLRVQVPYELIPSQRDKDGKAVRSVVYVADFVYKTADGAEVVEDAKGMRTPVYLIKRKLMLFVHGITIKEV